MATPLRVWKQSLLQELEEGIKFLNYSLGFAFNVFLMQNELTLNQGEVMSEQTSQVLFEVIKKNCTLGVITLNRPEKLNAITYEMLCAITNKLQDWETDNSIDGVVIRSNSLKSFCAGGDIKFIYDNGINKPDHSFAFFQKEYALNHYIHYYHKPYIALIHGVAMGGGLGLSIHGSYVIANNNLKLAMPETKIGFYPDVGATYFLSRLPTIYGRYLGLTGNIIGAEICNYLRLVNCKLPADEYNNALDTLLEQSPSDLRNLDTVFNTTHIKYDPNPFPYDVGFALEKPTVSSILENLQKANSEQAKQILDDLNERCPLSLHLFLAAQQHADAKSFSECMEMEFAMTQQCILDTEFYEGIKALLIEKRKPVWRYKHEDLAEEFVQTFLSLENKQPLHTYIR